MNKLKEALAAFVLYAFAASVVAWALIIVIDMLHAVAGRFMLGGFLYFILFVGAMIALGIVNWATRPFRDPVRDPDISYGVMVVLSVMGAGLAMNYVRPFDVSPSYWVAAVISAICVSAFCLLAAALSDVMENADREAAYY